MKYRKLGNTDLDVSVICLGTMTFGQQNTETEGHQQMDFALERGVNFFDTAELYPVPAKSSTQGRTEEIIGTYFKNSNNRDKVILASKVTGPAQNLKYISDNLGFSKSRITEALHKNLSRLQTDYIDLYQMHWPERKTNYFGQRGYTRHDDRWEDNFLESISTMSNLIKEGKIRHYGLSNETPWGLHRVLELCNENGLPRPVSIQNPYSLINRTYEIGMAEMSIRENIGLLAYSPLAMGLLSGKYNKGIDKPENRLNQFGKNYPRYFKPNCKSATQLYLELAEDNGLSLALMALAFVNEQFFLTSNIIGATDLSQLEENIQSIDIVLDRKLIKEINDIHESNPNPAP